MFGTSDEGVGATLRKVRPTEETAEMTGLELLQGLKDGTQAPSPMLRHLPASVAEFGEGFVELRARVDPAVAYNDIGIAHGGWALTLLDTAMGLAAITQLPRGATCPSTDVSVRFFKPVRVEDGEVRIIGRVISSGRRLIAAEGRIEGQGGRVYASGTAAFMPVKTADYATRAAGEPE